MTLDADAHLRDELDRDARAPVGRLEVVVVDELREVLDRVASRRGAPPQDDRQPISKIPYGKTVTAAAQHRRKCPPRACFQHDTCRAAAGLGDISGEQLIQRAHAPRASRPPRPSSSLPPLPPLHAARGGG
eukprot:scaffold24572_cov65-Phaeocystis_antarctica.AAC.12